VSGHRVIQTKIPTTDIQWRDRLEDGWRCKRCGTEWWNRYNAPDRFTHPLCDEVIVQRIMES
jgi:transposase-like protein